MAGDEEREEPEWHGVTTQAGMDLRIPAGVLRVNFSTGTIEPVPVQLRTDVWPIWLEIARLNRDAAAEARSTNPGVASNGPFQDSLAVEFRHAMTSMVAIAVMFEALASSIVVMVPGSKPAPGQGTSADGRIHQILTRGFKLDNQQSSVLRDGLKQMFRFRDQAVHPRANFADPHGHPAFGTLMEPRYVRFRVENARTAVAFGHVMAWMCLKRPRARGEEFVKWCSVMQQQIGEPTEQTVAEFRAAAVRGTAPTTG